MAKQTKLSNTQIKFLRGIGHNLNAMIIIGQNGVTENLLNELELTLEHHEILKIKIATGDREDRKAIIQSVLDHTKAQLVQSIGKTVLIYRQAEKSEFELPK